jgi:hypothetical protein
MTPIYDYIMSDDVASEADLLASGLLANATKPFDAAAALIQAKNVSREALGDVFKAGWGNVQAIEKVTAQFTAARKAFLEAVSQYHKLGEMVYRESNLRELSETLGNIVTTAEGLTIQESEHWFDNVTVSRHMKQLQEAYKVMNIASKYMNEVSDVFNQMAKTPISDDNLKKFIVDVMKPEYKYMLNKSEEEQISTRFANQAAAIYDFAMSHPTQTTDAARGTVWGAYNSISGYYNYIQKYKNDEQKFSSQMFGAANNKITKGFKTALDLMNV